MGIKSWHSPAQTPTYQLGHPSKPYVNSPQTSTLMLPFPLSVLLFFTILTTFDILEMCLLFASLPRRLYPDIWRIPGTVSSWFKVGPQWVVARRINKIHNGNWDAMQADCIKPSFSPHSSHFQLLWHPSSSWNILISF